MLRPALVAALALSIASSLHAQRLGPPADRPSLRESSDTNDAQAYYAQGLQQFERDPDAAAAAFYWAARINPAWAEPLYARRAALIMRSEGLTRKYFERSRNDRGNDDLLRVDSLEFRAMMLNPFLFEQLERRMFTTYLRTEIEREARRHGGDQPMRGEVDYYIDRYLRSGGPSVRGWLAYADGNFDTALGLYATALHDSRNKASVHLTRARIFGMRSEVDSAVAEFDAAITDLRTKEQKDVVIFYNSKASAQYSKAVLLEGAGNVPAAREAYAQALQEDLAYYPAHLRLGLLALGAKDTTAAMNELALAAEVAADEPHIRYVRGFVLAAAGHNEEAAKELEKAIQLEPYYALPYLRLGQVYEQLAKGKEALAAYEAFLARASQHDVQREYATARATEVREIMAATP